MNGFVMTRDKHKPDDPEQSKRFIEAARDAESDESEEGANRTFKKIVPSPASRSNAKKDGA